MTDIALPAQSYEEALPYLRAPYQPNQVRALIINAPDSQNAPCHIALYAIGETAMDRFNLICAHHWSRIFETVLETERKVGNKTFYYCEVRAIVVAFGEEQDDIGEAEAESHGAAMMNARAQAWKRGGRWHGPGQCLYAAEQILLRRSDKDDELFVPKGGENPHKHPYMKQGGQERCRREYQKWLTNDGEAIYGEPLDHLALYREIARRALGRPAQSDRPALPPTSREAPRAIESRPPVAAVASSEPLAPEVAQAQPELAAAPTGAGETSPLVERRPMPDEPAEEATVRIAESVKFDAAVAHGLSNLARGDGQTGSLTDRQQSVVLNWLIMLSDLKLSGEEIVQAVGFVAGRGSNQESRQATFTRWIASKAAGGQLASPPANNDAPATQDASQAPTSDAADGTSQPASDRLAQATPAVEVEGPLDTERALVSIHRAMDTHGYSDRTVTQLAALAVGVGPKGKVDWGKVPPQMMGVLADLLDSAGVLSWTPDTLAKEVLKAHNNSAQSTAAGRFSAFAGHLTDLAEARSAEAA